VAGRLKWRFSRVFIRKKERPPGLGGLFETWEICLSLVVRKPPVGGGKQNDDRNNKSGEEVKGDLEARRHSKKETVRFLGVRGESVNGAVSL
jgi:hypothetical protein